LNGVARIDRSVESGLAKIDAADKLNRKAASPPSNVLVRPASSRRHAARATSVGAPPICANPHWPIRNGPFPSGPLPISIILMQIQILAA
jgi:hypothetical protein